MVEVRIKYIGHSSHNIIESPVSDDEEEEVFQVKKSSVSRRLIKEKKRGKKDVNKILDRVREANNSAENTGDNHSENGDSAVSSREQRRGTVPAQSEATRQRNIIEPELDIKLKDNLPARKEPKSWILSGREAEALHFEDEDDDDDDRNGRRSGSDGSDEDPIRNILTSKKAQ